MPVRIDLHPGVDADDDGRHLCRVLLGRDDGHQPALLGGDVHVAVVAEEAGLRRQRSRLSPITIAVPRARSRTVSIWLVSWPDQVWDSSEGG